MTPSGRYGMTTSNFWFDKKVLITGHTGFKGGWLSLWLQKLGAEVSRVNYLCRLTTIIFAGHPQKN